MIRAVSTDPKEVIAALDDDLKTGQIVGEKLARDGTLLYRVQWQDTLLQKTAHATPGEAWPLWNVLSSGSRTIWL